MKTPGIFLGSNFLTVIADKTYSITTGDSRYEKALSFIKDKNWNAFYILMDKPAAIARYSNGLVSVYDNEVHYNNVPVHGVIAERILKFMEDGFDFKPLVFFLDNLYKNMDADVRERLYAFLENNKLAITENGSFLAFKLVNQDGTPIYNSNGTFLDENGNKTRKYEVGKSFFFPREKIVKTTGECSTEGLYVGNRNYWNGAFDADNNYTGNGRMLIVEVYPQDVCNVPHADATKIVVCELHVVDEYKSIVKESNSSLFGGEKPESGADISELWDNFDSPEFNYHDKFVPTAANAPKRDSKGRFAKKTAPVRDAKGRFAAKATNKRVKRDSKGRFTS